MSASSLAVAAHRYAKAIFELGVETGQLESLTRQLAEFAECYAKSEDLSAVLDNPLVAEDQREAILADVARRMGLGETVVNALRLLALRRRLAALPEIAAHLSTLGDQKAGVVRAVVTAATALPDDYYRTLTQELEVALSRKVVIERRQDPSLIAGVVTQIGDNTIDGSVRGRLGELERRLLHTLQ